MRLPSDRSAFTLIELSIVLVIIGLIVGGILVGRDMIEAARVRATVSQYEKFLSAANTFKLKYGGLPGDLTTAQATAIGFAPLSRPNSGNAITGDGLIENGDSSCTYNCNSYMALEADAFWSDLSQANLIANNIAPTAWGPVYPANTAAIANYVPQSPLALASYWFLFTVPSTTNYYHTVPPKPGTYFMLTGATDAGATTIQPTLAITPNQAFAIDTKIDDGSPFTGNVVGGNETDYKQFAPGYGWHYCMANTQWWGDPVSGYMTYGGYGDQPECQLSFFFTQ